MDDPVRYVLAGRDDGEDVLLAAALNAAREGRAEYALELLISRCVRRSSDASSPWNVAQQLRDAGQHLLAGAFAFLTYTRLGNYDGSEAIDDPWRDDALYIAADEFIKAEAWVCVAACLPYITDPVKQAKLRSEVEAEWKNADPPHS